MDQHSISVADSSSIGSAILPSANALEVMNGRIKTLGWSLAK
jgi:hypothetical protein